MLARARKLALTNGGGSRDQCINLLFRGGPCNICGGACLSYSRAGVHSSACFLLAFKGMSEDNSSPLVALSFVVGAICSGLAGYLGMKVATKANVRTTNAARTSLGKALEVAFGGGSVMGLPTETAELVEEPIPAGSALAYAVQVRTDPAIREVLDGNPTTGSEASSEFERKLENFCLDLEAKGVIDSTVSMVLEECLAMVVEQGNCSHSDIRVTKL